MPAADCGFLFQRVGGRGLSPFTLPKMTSPAFFKPQMNILQEKYDAK
jgi:hypothetical protein